MQQRDETPFFHLQVTEWRLRVTVSPHGQMPPRNRLLAALPSDEYERLLEQMEIVFPPLEPVLYEAGEPIPYVYFPQGGVFSLIVEMANGAAVEVATVGSEGMVGLPVFLGAAMMPCKAVTQISGDALRMKAADFRTEVDRSAVLHNLLHRYAQALLNLIMQSRACLRMHTIEERCCWRLLMTHDRVGTDRFPLTQELLGRMLGVRRQRANEVARALQKQDLLHYRRGRITIVSRSGLEAAACECYQAVKREFDRLIG